MKLTQTSNTVCFGMKNTVEMLAVFNLTRENGEFLFDMPKDSLVSIHSVYGISKHLPHIEGIHDA
jgi:hypothetical protein